jgi:hypothetical protein
MADPLPGDCCGRRDSYLVFPLDIAFSGLPHIEIRALTALPTIGMQETLIEPAKKNFKLAWFCGYFYV